MVRVVATLMAAGAAASPAQSRAWAAAGPPVATASQRALMSMGLAQFMHFGDQTFGAPDCGVDPGNDRKPSRDRCEHDPSLFNPTNLSTDQWAEAALAMGAGEICLTAHHEGGFALWDTAYSNFSVMHSPYGKDVVAQFVASCKKYGIRPCFYLPPDSNGYLLVHNTTTGAARNEAF
eukprot:gene18620-41360_t